MFVCGFFFTYYFPNYLFINLFNTAVITAPKYPTARILLRAPPMLSATTTTVHSHTHSHDAKEIIFSPPLLWA